MEKLYPDSESPYIDLEIDLDDENLIRMDEDDKEEVASLSQVNPVQVLLAQYQQDRVEEERGLTTYKDGKGAHLQKTTSHIPSTSE